MLNSATVKDVKTASLVAQSFLLRFKVIFQVEFRYRQRKKGNIFGILLPIGKIFQISHQFLHIL